MVNIVLLGFMGTGKSSVGRLLAQVLNWDFIDIDEEIEEVANMSVMEIFRRHGETRFRSEEKIMVTRLSQQEKLVIATGGGTVLSPLNWQVLAQNGIMIGLHASMEVILERIGHKNDRPLLKGPKEAVEKLWTERQVCYAQAEMTVDTSDKDIEEVVSDIVAWLGRKYEGVFSGIAENEIAKNRSES